MPEENIPMSLTNLSGGAAIEAFDIELARVLENIEDPNTVATNKRKITMEVIFKPNKERNIIEIVHGCKTVLAAVEPCETTAFLAKEKGKTVLHEINRHEEEQVTLPFISEVNSNA